MAQSLYLETCFHLSERLICLDVQSVDEGTFHAVMPADNPSDKGLQEAYKGAYNEIEARTKALLGVAQTGAQKFEAQKKPFDDLLKAQNEWKQSSLKLNKKAVEGAQAAEAKEVSSYLNLRIENIKKEITDLEAQLPSNKALLPEVLDQEGIPITDNDIKKDPGKSLSRR